MTPSDQKHFRFYRTQGRLYTVGTRQTREAVTRFRKRFPQVFTKLEPHLYLIGQDQGCIALEIALEDLEKKLQRRDLKFTLDDTQLKDFARSRAKVCGETSARIKEPTQALQAIKKLLARYSFDLPNSETDQGCIERTKCEKWWRKLIRKEQKRALVSMAIYFDPPLANKIDPPFIV